METKIHELNNFKNKVVSNTIKRIGKILVGGLIVIAGFSSCEKSDLRPDSSPTEIKEPIPIAAPTTWRVKSFQWHNKIENNHFENYVFRFNVDGSLAAIHNNITKYGRWHKQDNHLKIEFNQDLLSELNCAWTIVEHTRSKWVLKGLNPNDHSSQILELESVNFEPI